MTRQLFDAVASEYDVVRPDYPSQLFDTLESAMGQPLLRADVLDVGAGTGIASRALAGRGARVVALDPGIGMLRVLKARSGSRVLPVAGDGNALPFRHALFDLVLFAQSMHWTDINRSAGEALRVSKRGGVVAACRNIPDLSVDWYAEHQRRFFAACGQPMPGKDPTAARVLAQPPYSRSVAMVEIPWSRRISLPDYSRLLHTQSFVFALGSAAARVVDDELRVLRDAFPDGSLEEPLVTHAVLARA